MTAEGRTAQEWVLVPKRMNSEQMYAAIRAKGELTYQTARAVELDTVYTAFINAAPAAPPVAQAEPIADFDEQRVQLVYDMLCNGVGRVPPNPQEHWEGYLARQIVDAIAPPDPLTLIRLGLNKAAKKCEFLAGLPCNDDTDEYRRGRREALLSAANVITYLDEAEILAAVKP